MATTEHVSDLLRLSAPLRLRRDGRLHWPLSDLLVFLRGRRYVSARLLHRRLRMSRARGEKHLAELERLGVVGPRLPGGSREVLLDG